MSGASVASSTSTPTIPVPTHSFAGSRLHVRATGAALSSTSGTAIADLWVDKGVEQVGAQVGEAVDGGDDQDRALDERQIVPLDGEHQEPAEPRIGEHRLNDDDAADQPADIDGQHS